MDYLRIRNWEKWQTYRRDRGQPPWVKVYRRLMNDPDWLMLEDYERGQLVSLWVLAADRNGSIPADPGVLQSLCRLTRPPDLDRFLSLQWLEKPRKKRRRSDANGATSGRHDDANVTPEGRAGQERGGQERAGKIPSRKSSSSLTGGKGEPPPGAHGLGGRAPPARDRGNGAEKAASYRAQLEHLGVTYGPDDTLETLSVKLAQALSADRAGEGR